VILNAGIQALAVGAVAPLSDTESGKGVGTSAALNSPARSFADQAEPASVESTDDQPLVVSTVYDNPRRGLRAPLFAASAAEGELNSDGMFTPESKGAFGRPDVKVYTPTSEGSHGTVLLSAKKNMHLESGTRLLLVVAGHRPTAILMQRKWIWTTSRPTHSIPGRNSRPQSSYELIAT